MRKLIILLTTLLVLVLMVCMVGCGDDDGEETPTPVPTVADETPTPGAATPTPGYTGGEHTFKVAHNSVLTSVNHRRWEYANERLQHYTDGKVKLEILPAGSLYSSFQMWDALATGALDLALMVDYQFQMTGFVDYQILWLNFFWGETMEAAVEHNKRFWNHPDGGNKMFTQIEAEGVNILAVMPSINLQILANDIDMDSLYDMDGKKIAGTPGLGGLFLKPTGATLVLVDPSEFTMAFQQGLVDVLPRGPEAVYAYKLYELACCGFLADVLNVNQFFSMNMDLWNSLDPELQDIIQNKVLPEIIAWTEVELPASVEKALRDLEEAGMTLHYISPEERIEFRDITWEMAQDSGLLEQIDPDLLRLADALRSEPYDQAELPFP